MTKIMDGVTEYEEGMDVELVYENNRLAIRASNEAGFCCTLVDLIQLLDWVKTNKPELMNRPWVGLTEDEVMIVNRKSYDAQIGLLPLTFYRDIESALREKNNG
jgi:hypothetical protein